MSEANKAIVRRWCDQVNKGKAAALAAIDELCSPAYILHDATLGEIKGREGRRQSIETLLTGFSDLQLTIDDLVAEGNQVVCRFTFRGTHNGEFMGVAPTGKQVVRTGISVSRIADGKFVEAWQVWDALGLLQQLGAMPERTEANKTLVRRFVDEILNKGDLALVDQIIADNFVQRVTSLPELRGPEAFRQWVTALRAAFPDIRYTTEELMAEGDRVVSRWTVSGTHKGEWMGVAASGKPGSTRGTSTFRISGGKIVEGLVDWDALGFLQQIGAVPPLPQPKARAAA